MTRRPVRRLSTLALLLAVTLSSVACSIGSAESNQQAVLEQLEVMRDVLESAPLQVDEVSAWSTHDQSEHVLRANEGISGMIAADTVPDEVVPITSSGEWVLWWGSIPRGQGQAPEGTLPEGLGRDELLALHGRVVEAVLALDLDKLDADEHVVGNHPYFGGLTAAQWLRLMNVHGEHHADIVQDIRDAAGP